LAKEGIAANLFAAVAAVHDALCAGRERSFKDRVFAGRPQDFD